MLSRLALSRPLYTYMCICYDQALGNVQFMQTCVLLEPSHQSPTPSQPDPGSSGKAELTN